MVEKLEKSSIYLNLTMYIASNFMGVGVPFVLPPFLT